MLRLIVLLVLFVIKSLSAQDFQGVATYSSDRKMDIQLDSTRVNSEMQNQIQEMMRKQFQKEYTLRFNTNESVYKEEQTLNPTASTPGVRIMVAGSQSSDILYKNSKEKKYAAKREMFGKAFLVKDELTSYDWKLEDKTKKIGNYTCYKATAKRTVQTQRSVSINSEENTSEPKTEEVTIVAWYTPEIPVNSGPSTYWGLPGLIMEVSDGNARILCNKIVLNPKKKIAISAPEKGKVVTEDKFEEIMEKKIKEMQDRVPRGGENSFQIRVRG